MSRYDDDYEEGGPKRYHSVRTRQRERDDPDYIREDIYVERGKASGPPPPRDLVFRGREDSIEDIERDFPPPSGHSYRRSGDYGRPRRARSARGRYDDDYDDYDRYTDYGAAAGGGGGAAAGYAAGRRDRDRRRRRDYDRHDREYGSDYSDESPRRDRRKSGVGEMLEGLGLGGLAGAVLGKKDQNNSRDRDDRPARSRSRPGTSRAGRSYRSEGEHSRSRSRGKKTERKWGQAAQAALIAGAVEAFRSRKEPGPWGGEKAKRIATAAIGAGGIDRLIDKNPDEKSKRHLAEAVIGGLVANRLANGPRSKSRGRNERNMSPDSYATGRTGRSRSRSIVDRLRGRSASRGPTDGREEGKSNNNGIQGLVAGGALAAAGTAIYNRMRSKSRNRRERSRSSSADSYVPSRNRRRDMRRDRRSPRNNADTAAGAAVATRRMRDIDRGPGARDINSRNNYANNDRALAVGAGGGAAALAAHNNNQNGQHDKNPDHISDSSSTTSMENKRKKMKGKELITAGLATVATIHAVHGVYSSMQAHEKRHRLVAEGEMTPAEAKKRQTKAWVQDAAAVGIAALGIKGAVSEWKEMNEQRHEIHEIEKKKRERRKKAIKRRREQDEEHRQKMLEMMEKNPQAAMMMMHQDNINKGGYPMPVYMPASSQQSGGPGNRPYGGVEQSGNPYAPRGGGY